MSMISVVVPVYKVEKYIHRCVDSILNQTFSDFELILVDDGSPDNCGAICDEYAGKDSRVRVIHQENQGQAAARNHAVAESNARWICFVDSDDMIHPQMLEHLYTAATSQNTMISMCDAVEAEIIPEDFLNPHELNISHRMMDEEGLYQLIQKNTYRYWVVWGKLIQKEILEKFPFTPGRIYEDNAIVCQWLHEAGEIADLPYGYYFYQVNPEGTTKKAFSPKVLDYLWALKKQLIFYNLVGYRKIYESILERYFVTAISYHRQLREGNFSSVISDQLKKEMRCMYHKNWRQLNVDKTHHLRICSVLYPRIYHLYELRMALERKWRSEGILGVIRRVFHKLIENN